MQVVLVGASGHFRDSLVALLRSMPRLEIRCLERAEGSLQPEGAPDLVVVDADGEAEALDHLKAKWPAARVLALADRAWKGHHPGLAGADGVLPKSISVGEFLAHIDRQLRDGL